MLQDRFRKNLGHSKLDFSFLSGPYLVISIIHYGVRKNLTRPLFQINVLNIHLATFLKECFGFFACRNESQESG